MKGNLKGLIYVWRAPAFDNGGSSLITFQLIPWFLVRKFGSFGSLIRRKNSLLH